MTTKYLFLKNTQLVSLNSLLFICNTFCKTSKLSVSSDAVFRWNTFQWNFRDVLRKIWSFPSKWVDAHPQICEPVVTSTHIISRHKLRSRNKARAILQNWDSNKVRVETMDKLRGARHQNFTERLMDRLRSVRKLSPNEMPLRWRPWIVCSVDLLPLSLGRWSISLVN